MTPPIYTLRHVQRTYGRRTVLDVAALLRLRERMPDLGIGRLFLLDPFLPECRDFALQRGNLGIGGLLVYEIGITDGLLM